MAETRKASTVEQSLASIADSLEALCQHAGTIKAIEDHLCHIRKAFRTNATTGEVHLEISGNVDNYPS